MIRMPPPKSRTEWSSKSDSPLFPPLMTTRISDRRLAVVLLTRVIVPAEVASASIIVTIIVPATARCTIYGTRRKRAHQGQCPACSKGDLNTYPNFRCPMKLTAHTKTYLRFSDFDASANTGVGAVLGRGRHVDASHPMCSLAVVHG